MTRTKTYPITPVPKPRMTRSDKWKERACVVRYWEFKDLCRYHKIILPECGVSIAFHLPMPKSWPKKKKQQMDGSPHRQKPDLSNLLKALEDALYHDDSAIWHYFGLKKVWADEGGIEITIEG